MAPVKEKMEGLEGEKAVVSRERGEAEAKSWAELEHLRVTYEGLKHTSETIDRYKVWHVRGGVWHVGVACEVRTCV